MKSKNLYTLLTYLVILMFLLSALIFTITKKFNFDEVYFTGISAMTSAGMIMITGIQIIKSIKDNEEKNKPRLKIYVFTMHGIYIDKESGEEKVDKDGYYNYTFGTNMGEKSRSFQYLGICKKQDYSKIILDKKFKYGDKFRSSSSTLKYIYPYYKDNELQPKFDFITLKSGEVTPKYKINLTEFMQESKIDLTNSTTFYILYIDSTGYIFKEPLVY